VIRGIFVLMGLKTLNLNEKIEIKFNCLKHKAVDDLIKTFAQDQLSSRPNLAGRYLYETFSAVYENEKSCS
jgi:hypothetical protein